jgi:hypothetical protein
MCLVEGNVMLDQGYEMPLSSGSAPSQWIVRCPVCPPLYRCIGFNLEIRSVLLEVLGLQDSYHGGSEDIMVIESLLAFQPTTGL